jgi:hypothetical protein
MRIAIAALLALFFLLAHTRYATEIETDSEGRLIRPGHGSSSRQDTEEWKVPLDVHIMYVRPVHRNALQRLTQIARSKCPDALDCLSKLVVPAMSLTAPKVNFTLSYIGTPTDPDDGVSCKHGPSECLGNIIELCAAKLYPDPKQYLGFTLCMTREYPRIPDRELVHNCALEYGISFDELNDCASRDDGAYGIGLLRESVRHSSAVNATISCTVRLNGEKRCVRDGGEWIQCEKGSEVSELVDEIKTLWKEKNGKDEE